MLMELLHSSKWCTSLRNPLISAPYDHGHKQLISIPSVQQQKGSVDCGLFAIAFAVELAFNGLNIEDIQVINFDQDKMTEHLDKCLKGNKFEVFPKTFCSERLGYPKIIVIEK